MKLEKREITLNEYDSVLDMLCQCERLLELYKTAALFAERKEIRERIKLAVSSTLEETFYLKDLLFGIKSEQV